MPILVTFTCHFQHRTHPAVFFNPLSVLSYTGLLSKYIFQPCARLEYGGLGSVIRTSCQQTSKINERNEFEPCQRQSRAFSSSTLGAVQESTYFIQNYLGKSSGVAYRGDTSLPTNNVAERAEFGSLEESICGSEFCTTCLLGAQASNN